MILDNRTRSPYVSGSSKTIRFCKLIPAFCNNFTRAPLFILSSGRKGGRGEAALVDELGGAEGARPSPPPPASPAPCRCVSIPKNLSSPVLVGARWVEQLGAMTSTMAPSTRSTACSPAPTSACPCTWTPRSAAVRCSPCASARMWSRQGVEQAADRGGFSRRTWRGGGGAGSPDGTGSDEDGRR